MARGDFGFNAQISARSYGSRKVRLMTLDFSLEIIASANNEARSRRAFYPVTTDDSNFSISLGFVSWEEREAFNKWMSRFMASVSEGSAPYGVMTVRCPTRNFVRVGVPQGDLEYGEGIKDVAYAIGLKFVGAADPVDVSLSQRMAGISYFDQGSITPQNRFFYPQGQQIKGAESLEGTLFDTTASGAFTPEQADTNLDRHGAENPGV